MLTDAELAEIFLANYHRSRAESQANIQSGFLALRDDLGGTFIWQPAVGNQSRDGAARRPLPEAHFRSERWPEFL